MANKLQGLVQRLRGEIEPAAIDGAAIQGSLDSWYQQNFPGGTLGGGYSRSYTDPMQLINPMYTQQQQSDVDPIAMYRTAKETGMLPQSTNSFQPYTPPAQQQSAPVAVSRPVFNQPQAQGGK